VEFPRVDLREEDACYAPVVEGRPPAGRACPRGGRNDRRVVPRRGRAPLLDFRCGPGQRVFTAFTGTAWRGAKRRPRQLVLISAGSPRASPPPPWPANGTATARRCSTSGTDGKSGRSGIETGCHGTTRSGRPTRLSRRRGKKGGPHRDPDDPPRRRAPKGRGHGPGDNDRPPVGGVVGRQSGPVRRRVAAPPDGATWQGVGRRATWPRGTVTRDEGPGDHGLAALGRRPPTVCQAAGEGARDDDGDGLGEVHCPTREGLGTGLRNSRRPFRGVSPKDLNQEGALFAWADNVPRATWGLLRALLGVRQPTRCPT
jgi:hypothetical protein